MANEWVKVELYGANNDGCPRRYTIADGVSVSKGQTLKLIDPRTASGAILGLANEACAGVASMEKEANDGSTSIACWTDGVFEAQASGAIGAGNPICMAETNRVRLAPTTASGAQVIGYALEEAATLETINVRLRL